jgi:hypothetical protein
VFAAGAFGASGSSPSQRSASSGSVVMSPE